MPRTTPIIATVAGGVLVAAIATATIRGTDGDGTVTGEPTPVTTTEPGVPDPTGSPATVSPAPEEPSPTTPEPTVTSSPTDGATDAPTGEPTDTPTGEPTDEGTAAPAEPSTGAGEQGTDADDVDDMPDTGGGAAVVGAALALTATGLRRRR